MSNSEKMPGCRPWHERPMRVLDFCYGNVMDSYDMADVVKLCQRVHANTIHFQCHDFISNGGLDETVFYHRSRLANTQNRDVLGEFLPLAKEAGIRTVVYVCGHWFPKPFVEEHPDWWVRKADGTRLDDLYGDNDSTFCVNSPWRDWSFTLLEDICQYDIDGMFFDGPIYFLIREACFCEHCRKKFQLMFDRDMPDKPIVDAGSLAAWRVADREGFQRMRDMAVQSLVDYYRDAMKVLRTARPGIIGYANCGNAAEPTWTVGRDNRRLIQETDILAAEGGFISGRLTPSRLKTGMSSRLYETQAGGKPSVNAVTSALSDACRWCMHSPPELKVLLTEASTGVNPYLAIYSEAEQLSEVDSTAEVYTFLHRHEDYYEGSRSAANVALLHSTQTLDSYAGVDLAWADIGAQKARQAEGVGNFTRAFHGFYEMMLRLRVPIDLIDEAELQQGSLDRYSTLVLPNCACLSDAQCEEIKAFVRKGGTVIADFETSLYDEFGRPRKDFGLAELFGVHRDQGLSGPRRWDYVFPTQASSPYCAREYFPASEYNLRIRVDDATVHAVYSEPAISNISASLAPSEEPFLLENPFGQGRCFYFAGQMGEQYERHQSTDLTDILRALLAQHAELPLQIDGPPHLLDVHLRRQEQPARTLLHLVNLEVGAIEQILPAANLSVTLRVETPPSRVRTLKSDSDLPFTTNGDHIAFILPDLNEYEVIVVE